MVIVELMIGDLLPLFCLQQEMIDEMIAWMIVIVEMIEIIEMIPHLLPLHRLPSMIKMGRKQLMVVIITYGL